MSIKVLFFGATADIVGKREISHSATNSSELLAELLAKHPRLSSSKLLVSLNQEYVTDDVTLTDGDEVAIFTAVSGG